MPSSLSTHALVARALELRRTWYASVIISVVSYFYLLAQFPTGNHDWARMDGIRGFSRQVESGRWFDPAVFALTGFRQLPFLNASLALVTYVSAGFALAFLVESCSSSKVPRAGYAVSGLVCALIPFSNWTLYYSWQAIVGPFAQLLCIGATCYVVNSRSWRSAALGGVVFCLSMATYQSSINTAAVLYWLVAILLVAVPHDGNGLREQLRPLLILAGSVALGALLYKLSLTILQAEGIVDATSYQFKFLRLGQIPRRAVSVARISILHFFKPHPFFPLSLKAMLALLSLVGILVLLSQVAQGKQRRPELFLRAGTMVVGLLLMCFCSKLQFLVSQSDTYLRNRFAAFGPTFVYLPLIVLGTRIATPTLRTLYLVGCGVTVWACIVQDFLWQDAYVKQNEYDKRYINRVIARIESVPGFRYDKEYDLVQVGLPPNIRPRYYDYSGAASPYHRFTIMPRWEPANAYEGLEPRLRIRRSIHLKTLLKKPLTPKIRRLVTQLRRSRPWPDASSVSIIDNQIVVILTQDALSDIQKRMKRRR